MTYQPPPRRDASGDFVEPESTGPVYPTVRTIPPAHWRAIQVIWFLAGLIDVLVGLRFLLKLFGASTTSPFVTLLYSITAPLVGPFAGIFPTAGTTTFVFEPADLVALVIYPLIALGLVSLIRIMGRRSTLAA